MFFSPFLTTECDLQCKYCYGKSCDDIDSDFAKRPLEKWVKERYNPGIQHLVRFWVNQIDKSGKVLRLYPFLELIQSLLHDEKAFCDVVLDGLTTAS